MIIRKCDNCGRVMLKHPGDWRPHLKVQLKFRRHRPVARLYFNERRGVRSADFCGRCIKKALLEALRRKTKVRRRKGIPIMEFAK